MSEATKSSGPIDVAIIGGGVGGLYLAHKLTAKRLSFRVYESTARFGGRIRSLDIPGVPIHAELGAMRMSSRHKRLSNLFEALDLTKSLRPFSPSHNAFYLRGRRLSEKSLTLDSCYHCAATLPYALRPEEARRTPGALVHYAIKRALEDLHFEITDRSSMPEKIRSRINRGVLEESDYEIIKRHGRILNSSLYDIGFWNLLQHYLSNEAFLLVHDGLGYESVVGNWNAADAIPWFLRDFDSNQTMYTLDCGFERIITLLIEKIGGTGSGLLMKDTEVKRLARLNGDLWNVYNETGDLLTTARHVALAVPKSSLRGLRISTSKGRISWPKDKEGRSHLDAVRGHRLFKFFLVYEAPWWRATPLPGGESGYVTTDLPIRQVYYFGDDWMQQHATPERIAASGRVLKGKRRNLYLVMASYSDSHYVSFWRPFADRRPPRYVTDTSKLFERDEMAAFCNEQFVKENCLSSDRMVSKVQQQLSELHGVSQGSLPSPVMSVFADWGESGESGWHTWEVRARSWKTLEALAGLGRDEHLWVVGEAYSSDQGWIEGALESAENCFGGIVKSYESVKPAE